MRIGQFSETNGISIDTVRHYMDLGLIVPEKSGGQYRFDERCQQDLELVLELKEMGFTLQEMKRIFVIKHLATLTGYEKHAAYQSLFRDKYQAMEEQIKQLEQAKQKLKEKLDAAAADGEGPVSIGVPLALLERLRCFRCKQRLTLQDGIIQRNQIMEGMLLCSCGEQYPIEAGILCAGDCSQQRDAPVEIPHQHHIFDYIEATDPYYLENVYQGTEWAKRKLNQVPLRHKLLLDLGSGVGFFLRAVYSELPDDCMYIAVDHHMKWNRFLKQSLERTGIQKNVVFICADFLQLPLVDECADVVIDATGSSNYGFEHEQFLLGCIDPLVKRDAHLLGSYIAFHHFSTDSKIEPRLRHNFIKQRIQENLQGLRYISLDERTSPNMDQGGVYEDFFVQGEEVYTYSYFGKRSG
ncbi:MerR family transcriptional regulator [Paenibacillus turpanensis]|uniref:MerR family transcriptional regulator n=1 Tax=Paenibacillus turpanensis TaxID=2689078 RepID=UPI0014072FB0|nr:MerR family transcriptional regulator [Paenibacillus turpanensis]